MNNYKRIFLSDSHFIANGCQGDMLADFLDNNWCDELYLVGDIIDGWRASSSIPKALGLYKNSYDVFCDKGQIRAIKKLLSKISRIDKVHYIIGNHDDFMKDLVGEDYGLGSLSINNQYELTAINGKKYLILHGHQFDGIIRYHKWLAFLADYSYSFLIYLSNFILKVRSFCGFKSYWSLSYTIKHKVKQGVNAVYQFEETVIDYCKKEGYDGVICGHTHYPVIKNVEGIVYLNTGDWVDSCTAIVETHDGDFELIKWRR